uniref:NADH-ubiquinone oxidoreductase chain 6 n=1 Tax=Melicertum octocostatum TaxID=323307 RepID=A0A0S2IAQ7_9CNID|nr:NADH dehydrogenase subunit 6 [Melicertum octocostatum]
MEQFFFFLSFIIIISAIMTITSYNPIHSVFWLVIVFLNSAGLLISLKFEFISLMLIIIYVGAIAILFLFVIMMLDILQLKKTTNISHIVPVIVITSVNIILQTWWIYNESNFAFLWSSLLKEWDFEIMNHMNTLGLIFYTEYAYPFIILSLLLLVAMVGAIVLTLELGSITRRQSLSNQHQRNNSWT